MTHRLLFVTILFFSYFAYAMDDDLSIEKDTLIDLKVPNQIAKESIVALPLDGRVKVLRILGWSQCTATGKSSCDDFFWKEVRACQPSLVNADEVGPMYAKAIERFKKWQAIRQVFSEHNIELMSDDDYERHLQNLLQCAIRVRNTLAYRWYSCKKTVKFLKKTATGNYDNEATGYGLQKLYKDPLLYAGALLFTGAGSLTIKFIRGLTQYQDAKTKEKQEMEDWLNGEFWTWGPEVLMMQKAQCGASYSTQIPTNYTIFNNTVVEYPNLDEAGGKFCSAMGDRIKDFVNNMTHTFKPSYPVSDTDLMSFWFECLHNLRGNFSKLIGHRDNATKLYPVRFEEMPKMAHKGVFTTEAQLVIPEDFPKNSAHMEIAYDVVDTKCYVNYLMNKDGKNILTYMYDCLDRYSVPWKAMGLLTLDTALFMVPLVIVCGL